MLIDIEKLRRDGRLATAIASLSKAAAIARTLSSAVKSGDILSIDRALVDLAKARSSVAECLTYLEGQDFRELEGTVSSTASQFRLTYASELSAMLAEAGYEISGEWPVLVINDVVRLQVDVRGGSAVINGRKLSDIKPQVVADRVARVVSELNASVGSDEFVRLFIESYYTAIRSRGLSEGDYVDLRAVWDTVRTSYGKGLSYDLYRFGADIYKTLKAWKRSDISLDLSPAQNASRGLFIPGTHGGNFIAAVRLVRNA